MPTYYFILHKWLQAYVYLEFLQINDANWLYQPKFSGMSWYWNHSYSISSGGWNVKFSVVEMHSSSLMTIIIVILKMSYLSSIRFNKHFLRPEQFSAIINYEESN